MKISAGTIAVCLLIASEAWASGPVTILARPGADYEKRAAELAHCTDVAQRAGLDDLPPPAHPAGMPVFVGGGGLGAVLGSYMAAKMEMDRVEHESRQAAEQVCIRNSGYVDLPLTPDEAAAYRRISSSEQAAWEKALLATDLSARLGPLVAQQVPDLPPYRNGPFVQGGLKIDPDSLHAADGEIVDQGDIVTGHATRWRTATLTEGFETKTGNIRVAAGAGAVFHQVDHRWQSEPLLRTIGATWCGPVREMANGNTAKATYCFTAQRDGYWIYRPTGQDWFAGPCKDGFVLPLYDGPIKLEERAQDDLGAMDFAITVIAANRGVVQLAAYVRHDGKQSEVWHRDFAYDSIGQAVLPLWNNRLKLTRTGRHSVKAELLHDGNGTSWREGD